MNIATTTALGAEKVKVSAWGGGRCPDKGVQTETVGNSLDSELPGTCVCVGGGSCPSLMHVGSADLPSEAHPQERVCSASAGPRTV